MKPFLVLGFVSTLVAGSFVAGRIAATRPGPTQATGTTAAADTTVAAEPAGATDRAARPGPEKPRETAAPAVSGTPDTTIVQAPLEETAEATMARRVETDTRLTKELGNIPEEQRRFLIDLNDRAIEFQRRLAGEFQRGTISHEDYMQRVHEEMLNQLEELNALVSDDQYRVLTGLEPGADPFDYMTSGVGAAQAVKGAL